MNEYKRYLCHSITFTIAVFIASVIRMQLPLQHHQFAISVSLVAMAVLPLVGHHVGEIISKGIINMVVYIPGALLGHELRGFSEEETGRVIIPVVLFIMIVPGIFVRFVLKVVMDGYEYPPIAFLVAMCSALQTNEFDTNIKTFAIACSLIVVSTLLISFFAGDEVHDRVQENINDLADIYKELDQKCFGQNTVYKILQDETFLELLQSLINSEDKNKFFWWEFWLHPHQKQYEKMGDLIRHCAFSILSLSTVENLNLSTHLRETCKEVCSESAKVLALISDSMKNKTAPAASIDVHLTRLQNLSNHLKENTLEFTAVLKSHPDNTLELIAPVKLESHPENKVQFTNPILMLAWHPENMMEFTVMLKLTSDQENIHIISHLLTSVNFIEQLTSSIKELAALVPFKQSEHDSNLPEQVTGFESPIATGNSETQREEVAIYINPPAGPVGNSETQREEDNLGQGAIDMNPPAGPVRVN